MKPCLVLLSRHSSMSRRSCRGVMMLTLLVLVVLLTLGMSYLSLIERDNRFTGLQEREEQAWFLAKSGLEYYRNTCGLWATREPAGLRLLLQASGNSLVKNEPITYSEGESETLLEGVLWARVYLSGQDQSRFFEIIQLPNGDILSLGQVVGTLSLTNGRVGAVKRSILCSVTSPGLEVGYDSSLEVFP